MNSFKVHHYCCSCSINTFSTRQSIFFVPFVVIISFKIKLLYMRYIICNCVDRIG